MKLSKKDTNLLTEAYRRYHAFRGDRTLTTACVGLGSPTQYKSKYFKSHGCRGVGSRGVETPRVKNWYTLTEKGVKMLERLLDLNTWEWEMVQSLSLNFPK